MALTRVKKKCNQLLRFIRTEDGFQQASSRFLKTTTESELMTKGGNLFHGSTIRTEKKQLFDEPNEKSDDATSGRNHDGELKTVE